MRKILLLGLLSLIQDAYAEVDSDHETLVEQANTDIKDDATPKKAEAPHKIGDTIKRAATLLGEDLSTDMEEESGTRLVLQDL